MYKSHPVKCKNNDDFLHAEYVSNSTAERAKFEIRTIGFTSQGVPYDYHSIMHYCQNKYSANGMPTIIPLQEGATLDENSPSASDFLHINLLYCGGNVFLFSKCKAFRQ